MNRRSLRSIIALAGLSVAASVHAANYSQGFTFANGTTSFGDGSALTNGGGTPASVQGNALELTSVNFGGTQNTFNIPALANSAGGFTMTFDVTLIDTAGGNLPADGFAVSYGNFGLGANFGEEGPGATSISWIVDTWDNGGGDQGIRSKINGANDFVQNFAPLADGQTIVTSVSLSWNPTNGMSLSIGGLGTLFTNRPTAGFTADNAFTFAIGARTGGATETVSLDNINITTVPETSSSLLSVLAGLGLLSVRRRK